MALSDIARRVAEEYNLSDVEVRKNVNEFIAQLSAYYPSNKIHELKSNIKIGEGLKNCNTNISQIPTYVTSVPNGTEKGLYLATDLGGTNFRVCSIKLNGDTTFNFAQYKVPIPQELMVAKTGKELFSFLARQIEIFLKEHHKDEFAANIRRRQTLSTLEGYRDEHVFLLGFTFSFPINQTSINKGTLMRWTKGFDIPDVVGLDVCELLQCEIDCLRLPIKVAALVNDTVGTLMARSYSSPGKKKTLLGAIFGTGTNGAYMEKLCKITKPMEVEYDRSSGEMVINVEWGSFDNDLRVLPNTPYDIILDKNSVNPGLQMFEKRVSGLFLGEILRITLLQLVENPSVPLFHTENSSSNDFRSTTNIDAKSPLFQKWALDSSFLSIAEGDNSIGLHVLRREIESSLGVSAPSIEDARAVKVISNAIAKRAARLAGVAIASIVVHSGRLSQSGHTSSIPSAADIWSDLIDLNLGSAASGMFGKICHMVGLKIDDEEDVIDIGVDGSLVEYYPRFEEYLREALQAIDEIGVEGERKIFIGIAKDGSGVGAALTAHGTRNLHFRN
ncbi:Glucokinase [Golovinomyces cichoracearum]|uniref:Phosphotransferase n=1 Tax=Golovinomyces cichoracearum TaxID=62708 RepID=A0A420INW0_9PEZI|nr:Glucokinase [Golovinomyces cichoracearum]